LRCVGLIGRAALAHIHGIVDAIIKVAFGELLVVGQIFANNRFGQFAVDLPKRTIYIYI